MIKQFEKLTKEETDLLLKAPVLVSVIAAKWNNEISENAARDAVKLAHLKTFTAVQLLQPYYKEVEKNFKDQFDATVARYQPFNEEKMSGFKKEFRDLETVISKLDKQYAETLRWSLSKFAAHVKKSDHVVLEDFIFPFILPGLNN